MSAWTKADGARIELRFSQPVNAVSDTDAAHFTVTVPEYNYVPGGTIGSVSKSVLHVSNKGLAVTVDLGGGTLTDTVVTDGVLRLGVA